MQNYALFSKRAKWFFRRWGLPSLLGGITGLVQTVFAIDLLVRYLGPWVGGALSSLSGIGVGLLMAVMLKHLINSLSRDASDYDHRSVGEIMLQRQNRRG